VKLELELQSTLESAAIPPEQDFRLWVEAVLAGRMEEAELVIRLVDEAESRELNSRYRGIDAPTNILSFPSAVPSVVESALLGDLVIAVPVVEREAQQQGKRVEAHWAHLVVHGVLHLLDYTHREEDDAAIMEGLEQGIMAGLGFPDPYAESTD
jgi:probable rRNA maturation factor